MIDLKVSGFNGKYSHLNAVKNLKITQLDMLRAMITVGNQGIGAVFTNNGLYTISERFFQCLAIISNNYSLGLQVSRSYQNLESTEKGAATYRLGQALTKLYAEKQMQIPHLLHTSKFTSPVQLKSIATPKRVIYQNSTSGQTPDLLGIDVFGNWHVFESKARSGIIDKKTRQEAINQVSRIQTINNVAPDTRVACSFNVKRKPFLGYIDDPIGDYFDIKFNFEENLYISNYYKEIVSLKDSIKTNKTEKIFNRTFKYLNVDLGIIIDEEIFEEILKKDSSLTKLNEISKKIKSEVNPNDQLLFFEEKTISIGLDGIGIIPNKYSNI